MPGNRIGRHRCDRQDDLVLVTAPSALRIADLFALSRCRHWAISDDLTTRVRQAAVKLVDHALTTTTTITGGGTRFRRGGQSDPEMGFIGVRLHTTEAGIRVEVWDRATEPPRAQVRESLSYVVDGLDFLLGIRGWRVVWCDLSAPLPRRVPCPVPRPPSRSDTNPAGESAVSLLKATGFGV